MTFRRLTWIAGGLAIALAVPVVPARAAEESEVIVSASRLLMGELPQTGALSLLSRDGIDDFEVDGDDANLNRIDGRNHDLTGVLTGAGDKPGVATDVDADDVATSDVSINGSVAMEGDIVPFDIVSYINFLRPRADLVITENTTYDGGTIGGPADAQIVVLEDAKLFLQGGFTGYGILILYDTDPGNGQAELRMEDQAAWYGVVLSYTGDTPGNSDKIRIRLGKQHDSEESGSGSSSGKGKGSEDPEAGEGVKIYGMVIAAGREIEVEFPNKAVADLFYSSEAVDLVDAALQEKPYLWERWREKE